jgi:hypothetical protein
VWLANEHTETGGMAGLRPLAGCEGLQANSGTWPQPLAGPASGDR